MPNANYIKGRRKEYKIMKELRDARWDIVTRSAGSHSAIDIIAIRRIKTITSPQGYIEVKLIQSKRGRLPLKDKLHLENKYAWLNGLAIVKFEVR